MYRLLSSVALLTLVAVPAAAQSNERLSVLVYPFGATSEALMVDNDFPALTVARALEGVQETGRFAAINESANPAIRAQTDGAKTLAQFESAVQIRTDRQLQSKYMLTGFVESADVKPMTTKDGKPATYGATVVMTVMLYDVETREAITTTQLTLNNGIVADRPKECPSGMRGIRCRAEQAAKAAGDKALAANSGGLLYSDDTAAKAIASAMKKAPAEIAALLNEKIQ